VREYRCAVKLFRFDADVGFSLSEHPDETIRSRSANAVIFHVARTKVGTHVGVFHVGAGGVIGRHPATTPQLFLIVAGEGWVSAEDRKRVQLTAGQGAFWAAGEDHESGSDTGMTAVVVEAADEDLDRLVREL
jgi:quercetin dioxygenase-like cupin family protein